MGEGFRLVHPNPDFRGAMYTIEHPLRPYHNPIFCNICAEHHVYKTYHLELDGEGAVLVSKTVFERLREIGMAGLVLTNTVSDPPPITIRQDGARKQVLKFERKKVTDPDGE